MCVCVRVDMGVGMGMVMGMDMCVRVWYVVSMQRVVRRLRLLVGVLLGRGRMGDAPPLSCRGG